jgi:ATP-binding cassette subfamily B (MDR/TAP) protein 1
MIAVGFIAGTFRFMQVAFLELFADSIAYKIKLEYFKATLRKDSTWFDAHNPNEMGTKIGKECQLIQRGIGEKIGDLYGTAILFVLGYAVAFLIGWEFSLILLGAIPIVLVSGFIMAKAGNSGVAEELIAYQQCAGIAEQSLQAIKVVHTYGREELESKNYNKYLNRTLD